MDSERHKNANHVATPRLWLALALIVLMVRGGALLIMRDSLSDDPDAYRAIALNLLRNQTFAADGYPTAFRPPLYPLLLVPCVALPSGQIMAVALLHLVLGATAVLCTYGVARRMRMTIGAGLAALLVACDPLLVFWSTRVMTETLAATLVAFALYALVRMDDLRSFPSAAFAGGALSLAALCRPALFLWLALVIGAALLQACTLRTRARLMAGLMLGMTLLLPWVVRNAVLFGRPIVATTHGGYTLLLANNPHFYQSIQERRFGEAWDPDSFFAEQHTKVIPGVEPSDELARDRQAYDEALKHIRATPGVFAYSCLVRLGRLWSPLAHRLPGESTRHRLGRYAAGVWYVIVYVAAIVGLWSVGRGWRKPPWLWVALLLVAISAVHAVFWTDMRMRAPMMPAVALLAACGTEHALRYRRPA